MPKYYVSEWALLRKAEIIELPEEVEIHSDYLKIFSNEEIIASVRNIRQMFIYIYQDISDFPEQFKMPMIEIREEELTSMGLPPAKALSSKMAPFMFFDALINVLISGYIENGELIIEDAEKLKDANKNYKVTTLKTYQIKNIDSIYSQFNHYGLYLKGLKKYKFTNDNPPIILSYPDDPVLLPVLKWMADKAHKFERRHDFALCQHRLLQDGMDSLNYGEGADYIADRLHTKQEQDCVYKLDAALRGIGLIPYIDTTELKGEGNYSLLYYRNEKDKGNLEKSDFRVRSKRMELFLRIRTRNIQNGVEHIKRCSDEVRGFFIPGDKCCGGCLNHNPMKGLGGQAYVIDGISYWKCGCSTGKFITLQPRSEEIADYITLAELCN